MGYERPLRLYARFTREILAGSDPRMKGTYDLRERISGLAWLVQVSLSHEDQEMIHFFWVKIKGAYIHYPFAAKMSCCMCLRYHPMPKS